VLPTSRLTLVSLMLPVPLGIETEAPGPGDADQFTLVSAAGNVSATVAPLTLAGPALVTTMV